MTSEQERWPSPLCTSVLSSVGSSPCLDSTGELTLYVVVGGELALSLVSSAIVWRSEGHPHSLSSPSPPMAGRRAGFVFMRVEELSCL